MGKRRRVVKYNGREWDLLGWNTEEARLCPLFDRPTLENIVRVPISAIEGQITASTVEKADAIDDRLDALAELVSETDFQATGVIVSKARECELYDVELRTYDRAVVRDLDLLAKRGRVEKRKPEGGRSNHWRLAKKAKGSRGSRRPASS